MRKTIMILAILIGGGWLAAGFQGNMASRNPDNFAGGVVEDIKAQAAEEFKKTFSTEVEEFFKDKDLAVSLGISSEEQSKLENSIKNYITSYSADETKLDEAKQAVEGLLENAQGLSAEEIQAKISDIFD